MFLAFHPRSILYLENVQTINKQRIPQKDLTEPIETTKKNMTEQRVSSLHSRKHKDKIR